MSAPGRNIVNGLLLLAVVVTGLLICSGRSRAWDKSKTSTAGYELIQNRDACPVSALISFQKTYIDNNDSFRQLTFRETQFSESPGYSLKVSLQQNTHINRVFTMICSARNRVIPEKDDIPGLS